jgi:hypothetical protein
MIEEIVRGTLLELLERNLLVSWPSNAVVESIVQQLEAEDDDGQPSWEQEWYDFGERYE